MRPSKEEYYLHIADKVSERSTCLRRHYGAVIVKNDRIVATGYNGAPRKTENCTDLKTCIRKEQNIPHGSQYELCRSVHAEQNALIHGAYEEMLGSTLYIFGREAETGEMIFDVTPCTICKRMIINAGISTIIVPNGESWKEIDLTKIAEETRHREIIRQVLTEV